MAEKCISSIMINGQKFTINNAISNLQEELSNIRYDNYYMPLQEIIENIEHKIEDLTSKIYSIEANLKEEISMLRTKTSEKSENPKQKFDLEIFEEIEASNPFLLNLK